MIEQKLIKKRKTELQNGIIIATFRKTIIMERVFRALQPAGGDSSDQAAALSLFCFFSFFLLHCSDISAVPR